MADMGRSGGALEGLGEGMDVQWVWRLTGRESLRRLRVSSARAGNVDVQ